MRHTTFVTTMVLTLLAMVAGQPSAKRIAGHYSFGTACGDTVSVRAVQRYAIPTGATAASFTETLSMSVLPGRRYLVEMLRPASGPSGNYARISVGGIEYFGTADLGAPGVMVSRTINPIASGTLQVTLSGSAGFGVDVRITQVAEPTYPVLTTSFQRGSGAPKWQSKPFAFDNGAPATPHLLVLTNGNPDGTARTQDTEVMLNGTQVVFPGELTTGMAQLTRSVLLSNVNQLDVKIVSALGTKVGIKIRATDTTPPQIEVSQPIEAMVTEEDTVLTSGTVAEGETGAGVAIDGVAQAMVGQAFSGALALPFDGIWRFNYEATNGACLTATATRSVIRDTRAPVLTVNLPTAIPATTISPTITVTGIWSDTSRTVVTIDGEQVGTPDSSGSFSTVLPLDLGANGFLFRARDALGHETSFKRFVVRGPANEDGPDSSVSQQEFANFEPAAFRDNVAFLFTGSGGLIQTGAVSDSIKPTRAAVLKGRVLSRDLGGLPNVAVRVLGHPEFGQTLTRDDGRFDLAVNGGQAVTLRFSKAGYLETQRTETPRVLDFTLMDDLALYGESSRLLPVTSTPALVASKLEADANGDRKLWVYVPSGVTATITPDGEVPRAPIDVFNIKVREATVGSSGPEAMPGKLPPTSAYTYCVDLALEEADSIWRTQPASALRPKVTFSSRLSTYLKDFLGTPVGTAVPSGYYDTSTGLWVPDEDGKVIKVVGDSAGVADIDTDGDGQAESAAGYDTLGLDSAERTKIASAFSIGDVVWRVRVDRFSGHDWNYNVGAAPGDTMPGSEGATVDGQRVDDPSNSCGCIIENENRVLGEDIAIAGTPYSLHYRSSRQPDDLALRTIRIPLVGPGALPTGLRRVHVTVGIAGRRFEQVFEGTSSQVMNHEPWVFNEWDGKDAYSRVVVGTVPATVRIGFEIVQRYGYSPTAGGQFGNSSRTGSAPTVSLSGDRSEGRIDWRTQVVSIGAPSLQNAGLGHWTITPHDTYDPTGEGTLLRGDGTSRSGKARPAVIRRYAGSGSATGSNGTGDNFDATKNKDTLNISPQRVAVSSEGIIYYYDQRVFAAGSGVIRRILPQGRVEAVVGGDAGATNVFVEGMDASLFKIGTNQGLCDLALGPDGQLYFIARTLDRVLKVDWDGTSQKFVLHAFAGRRNEPGDSVVFQQGIDAKRFRFQDPASLAVGPDGAVYVGDVSANKIYRIGTDGRIWDYAGNGVDAIPTIEGPSTAGPLGKPVSLTVNENGTLYAIVLAGEPNAVVEVSRAGRMRRILPAGDHKMTSVSTGPDGALYVGQDDKFSGIARRDPNGEWSILAGTIDNSSFGGTFTTDENSRANAVRLARLSDFAIGPEGAIYTAENGYFGSGIDHAFPSGIRRIAAESPVAAASELFYPSGDGATIDVFSLAGRHLRTVERQSGTVLHQFAYDAAGRLVSITDRLGHVTTIMREDGLPTKVVSPAETGGLQTHLDLNGAGYLVKVVHPAGGIDSLDYKRAIANTTLGSPPSLLTHHRTPEGVVRNFEYDDQGRLFKDIDAAGGYQELQVPADSVTDTTWTVEHRTAMGRLTEYQVKRMLTGIQTRLRRSPDLSESTRKTGQNLGTTAQAPYGEMVTETSPAGDVTTTRLTRDRVYGAYAPVGEFSSTRLPVSQVHRDVVVSRDEVVGNEVINRITVNTSPFESRYNTSARTLTLSAAVAGRTGTLTFDPSGRVTTVSGGGVAGASFSYHPSNGFLEQVVQSARTWTHEYDDSGRVARTTAPTNRTVSFRYDALGRVIRQSLPASRVVGYDYDRDGRITHLTLPGGAQHRFHYDAVGRNDRYVPPPVEGASDSTRFDYNLDGQLRRVTRPGGQVIELEYDPEKGSLTRLVEPRGTHDYEYWGTPINAQTPTPSGLLYRVSSPDGVSCDYAYDGPLLSSETWSGSVSGSVTRTYDNYFRLATESVNGAQTATYGYDADGLVTSVTGSWGTMTLPRDAASGRLTGTTVGVVTSTPGYNAYGELTDLAYTVSGVPYFSEHLERDDLGRIKRIDETFAGVTTSREFRYDSAGRLDSVGVVGVPTAERVYEYDHLAAGNGNRTRVRYGTGAVDTASYDAQDRLLSYGGSAYTWTAAGELMQRESLSERLSTTYDALGNLLSAGITPLTNGVPQGLNIGTTITYRVDGQGRRVQRSVGGVEDRGWLYRDGLSVVAELDSADAVMNRYVYASMDHSPDLMVRGGVTYRAITDHLGSVRALVSVTNGAVLQTISYDAWGEETSNSAPTVQSLGYAGGLTDAETKLVRFGARDYEPGVGRWTSKDPVGFWGGGANLFDYLEGDPLNDIDPRGTTPQSKRRNELSRWNAYLQCVNQHAIAFYGEWLAWSDFLGILNAGSALKDRVENEGTGVATALLDDLVSRGLRGGDIAGAGGIGVRTRLAREGARLAGAAGIAKNVIQKAGVASAFTTSLATGFSIGARLAFAGECECARLLLGEGK